jgi:hypothetical protein
MVVSHYTPAFTHLIPVIKSMPPMENASPGSSGLFTPGRKETQIQEVSVGG